MVNIERYLVIDAKINQKMYLIGDGAMKFKDTLTSEKFIFNPEIIYPSAKEMSSLSFAKFQNSEFVDVAYFEPFYLKDFLLVK